jgi:hypothetical protein
MQALDCCRRHVLPIGDRAAVFCRKVIELDYGPADFLADAAVTNMESRMVLACEGRSPFNTAVTCPEQK